MLQLGWYKIVYNEITRYVKFLDSHRVMTTYETIKDTLIDGEGESAKWLAEVQLWPSRRTGLVDPDLLLMDGEYIGENLPESVIREEVIKRVK